MIKMIHENDFPTPKMDKNRMMIHRFRNHYRIYTIE